MITKFHADGSPFTRKISVATSVLAVAVAMLGLTSAVVPAIAAIPSSQAPFAGAVLASQPPVGAPEIVKDRLDIGIFAACASLGSGQVVCAGRTPIPDGTTVGNVARTFTSAAIDAVGVGAGNGVACARKGAGTVSCWGDANSTGSGSLNPVTNATTPVLGVTDAVEVDAGGYHGCARLSGGTVRCWGFGQYGERGDGLTGPLANRGSSNVVDAATNAPLVNVRQIGSANGFSCALIADGTVKCWGENRGILPTTVVGFGLAIPRATSIPGLANVSSISLGTEQACALITDGSVKCFGNFSTANTFPGSGATSTDPKTVVGLSNVSMVAPGTHHSCALLADTTVTCWGQGDYGQLGRTSGPGYFAPAPVPGLTSVRSIHAGWDNTCAVLLDGTVRCWGRNDAGQLGIAGINISTPTDVPQFAWGGRFTPLNPARILDTRNGSKPTAGSSTSVTVRGAGGVPATANGVLVNITVIAAEGDGFASVTPCTPGTPNASNLNYNTGDTIPNLVAAPLTSDGKICIYTSAKAHLLADVAGYYDASGSTFTGLTPQRILDTRSGRGAPAGKVPTNGRVDLQVIGAATNVPANATGIVLNVTAVDANAEGYITVFPCTPQPPDASNLNFTRVGQTIPNLVAMPLSASGKVCFFTSAGVHLLADVAGYFGPTGPAFAPVDPQRLLDTRTGVGAPVGKLAAGATLRVRVRGIAGGAPTNAEAVVLNVTAVDPSNDGYLTVFPCGTQPDASNLNYSVGRNIPNLVMMPISASGEVCIFTSAATHILADINGHYRPQ